MQLTRSLPATIIVAGIVAGLALIAWKLAPPDPTTPTVPVLTLPIQVVAVGDIACGPAIEPLEGECQDTSVLANDADLVLTLGDTTYPVGAADEWPAFDAMWGDLPLIAVPGNHEYHTDNARPFYNYFGDRTSDLGYFAVDLPGWRVYGLNSNCSEIDCEAELRWLESERANEPACTLAMIHHPLRSTYRSESLEDVGGLYEALAGVDVILAGHSHNYERIDLGASELVIVGTGGRSVYAFDGPPVQGSLVRYDDAYGVLALTLEDGGYESVFRTFEGERDSYSASC